jgi:hypothetical protein
MTQTMIAPVTQAQPEQAQPVYEITEQDKKRQQTIAEAWQAYNGELEKPLEKMPGEADDNVMSNRCAPIVERGIDFLFGKEIEISIEDAAPQEAQDLLDLVWGIKEERIPLLQEWAMNGGNAGQGFLRIVPDIDGTFEIVNIDPSTVFVQTAPQNCKRVLLFCIQYSAMEKINTRWQEVFYREEIAANYPDPIGGRQASKPTSWSIQHWTQIVPHGMIPKQNSWTPAGSPIDWPYPFPPLFGNHNLPYANSYWGKPDLTPGLIGLNNALNLGQSSLSRLFKFFGAPIIYATGVAESLIKRVVGSIIGLPTPESKIVAVPVPTDSANALKFAADLRSDTDEESGVPGVATGRIATMPRGQLSGIALELLFMPILKKTEKKRCTYGNAIIAVSKALLVLNGFTEDINITLAWQNPLPEDDLPAVQAAVSKLEIGISKTTLMRELGYDPDEEAQLTDAEDAKALAKAQAMAVLIPPEVPGAPVLPGQQKPAPLMTNQQGGQP